MLPYSIVYQECLAKLLLRCVVHGQYRVSRYFYVICQISLTMGKMTFYFMPIPIYIPSCSILRLVKHAITSCQSIFIN